MACLAPFRVRVPASTSNLGPGFDTYSAALSLFLEIEVHHSDADRHEWRGDWPLGDRNIFAEALVTAAARLGVKLPACRFISSNSIPLQRGLGSSAAAITAALVSLSRVAQVPLDDNLFFELALPFEGHPDNLAAAWKGGWVLCWSHEGSARTETLPIETDLLFVVAIPELKISTARAREVLPEVYSKEDLIHTIQRSTLLLHALYGNRKELLAPALEDRIHQPFREVLIPGCREILRLEGLPRAAAPHHLGVYLSGSGSTICSLTDEPSAAPEIGSWMVSQFAKAGLAAEFHILEVSPQGAKVLDILE